MEKQTPDETVKNDVFVSAGKQGYSMLPIQRSSRPEDNDVEDEEALFI